MFLRKDSTFISTCGGGRQTDTCQNRTSVFDSSTEEITCVTALRALSPLEDPTATYVPQRPMAGRTAVGTRKDMGLFPGWTVLCYRNGKKIEEEQL